MTRAQKLAIHLEIIIWKDQPDGILTPNQVAQVRASATTEQRRRAYQRALIKPPLLTDEEKYPDAD